MKFHYRLKEDIRVEIRMAQPKGLGRIMDLAKKVEERNETLKKPRGQNASYGRQIPRIHTNFRSQDTATWIKSANPSDKTSSTRPTHPYRRLTEAEILEKREKGLCYRCDEKYNSGHICKRKEMQVLLVVGDEEEEDEAVLDERIVEPLEIREMIEISLQFVVGLTTPKTMKIRGKVCG